MRRWESSRSDRKKGGDRSQIRGGLVFEFSSQRIGKPLDDIQQNSAMASSVFTGDTCLWCGQEKERPPSNPALPGFLTPLPLPNGHPGAS